jgi:hypothetical protein
MYCQGLAKKVTGDANDNVRPPEPTGGFLLIDILNGGKLINMNAFNGEGGFLYETKEGNRIFQEMAVTERRKGTLDAFEVHMPNTNVPLYLHQVALATGYSLGICTSIMELFETGRCLHGVLEEGETLSCVPVCPAAHSLVADGIALDPSKRCDGDHTFGRDSMYLQGMSGVQGVEHRENVIRAKVEDKYDYWLNPLVIGKYRGGNPMPRRYSDRRLD